jgi:predicted NUDIX family NTP pyrophosphohydrolase
MPKLSAGLLICRRRNGELEVFLVHPGGPFWKNKDQGAWSIPKGEFAPGDDPLEAAKREFHEETGFIAEGPFQALQPLKQPSGKVVHAWLVEGDFDPTLVRSNTFKLEWPRNSRKYIEVPEVDRAEWFQLKVAREKILPGQQPFLDQLAASNLTGELEGVI